MVRLIRTDEIKKELRTAKGWLEGDDSFFDVIEQIIQDRTKHVPRVLKGSCILQKKFLAYRNKIKIGPGKIEKDIKQARQQRVEKYQIKRRKN